MSHNLDLFEQEVTKTIDALTMTYHPENTAIVLPSDKSDAITDLAHQLESMSKAEAFSIVPTLLENVDYNYFRLGGALAVIQTNNWWAEEGFDKFKTFVEHRFGLHYRKAMYLIEIYVHLVESGVPWYKVKDIGWTKLKEIARILTKDNVDEWVAKALSMTVLQLREAVAAFKNAATLTAAGTTEPDTSGVTTITFKVHPDQKETIKLAVEKAQKELSTDFTGVALEAICLNYLTGPNVATKVNLATVLASYKPEEVVAAFTKVWPRLNMVVDYDNG